MFDNRDFKGVWIERDIWLNSDLTMLEKVIFVEIDSLDNENHCVAGNEYFADFCNCSVSKITKAIKKLQDLGMIEVMAFDGRHRQIRVVKNTRQTRKKYEADLQKVRANNIANSNKTISKDIVQNFDFGANNKKEKKLTLWDKCVQLIDDFTTDAELRKILVTALKQFLDNSKESGITLYTNNFKGKLNNLKKLTDDHGYTDVALAMKIVQQTLDKGWNDFYELKSAKSGKTRNAIADIEHLSGGVSERAEHKGGKIYGKF